MRTSVSNTYFKVKVRLKSKVVERKLLILPKKKTILKRVHRGRISDSHFDISRNIYNCKLRGTGLQSTGFYKRCSQAVRSSEVQYKVWNVYSNVIKLKRASI